MTCNCAGERALIDLLSLFCDPIFPSQDGYLYGRGASDNKGPLLGMIFAAVRSIRALQRANAAASASSSSSSSSALPLRRVSFVFCLEGEGENGSLGFREAVLQNLEWMAGVVAIINTNNTWLGEVTPCLTYGMRGIVKLKVEVEGAATDLHSGLDGGLTHEPLVDLCDLLSSLSEPTTGRIAVPGIYADVSPLSPEELQLYTSLDFNVRDFVAARGLPGVYSSTNLRVRSQGEVAATAASSVPAGGLRMDGGSGGDSRSQGNSVVGVRDAVSTATITTTSAAASAASGGATTSSAPTAASNKRPRAASPGANTVDGDGCAGDVDARGGSSSAAARPPIPPSTTATSAPASSSSGGGDVAAVVAHRKVVAARGDADAQAERINTAHSGGGGSALPSPPQSARSGVPDSSSSLVMAGGAGALPAVFTAVNGGTGAAVASTAAPSFASRASSVGSMVSAAVTSAAPLPAAPSLPTAPAPIDLSAVLLLRRWREPSLTVHGISASAANDSIIPRAAVGYVSLRTVPVMTAAGTFSALEAHLRARFAARRSVNRLRVTLMAHAAWWLESPSAPLYVAAAGAVARHWGVPPIFVREGGTVRVTTFLQKVLRAPALHLPVGQSSDAPHLPNERIRLLNLVNGVGVLETLFLDIAGGGVGGTSPPQPL